MIPALKLFARWLFGIGGSTDTAYSSNEERKRLDEEWFDSLSDADQEGVLELARRTVEKNAVKKAEVEQQKRI